MGKFECECECDKKQQGVLSSLLPEGKHRVLPSRLLVSGFLAFSFSLFFPRAHTRTHAAV